jgi:hypothetical protein
MTLAEFEQLQGILDEVYEDKLQAQERAVLFRLLLETLQALALKEGYTISAKPIEWSIVN